MEKLYFITGMNIQSFSFIAEEPGTKNYRIYLNDYTKQPTRVYMPHVKTWQTDEKMAIAHLIKKCQETIEYFTKEQPTQ